jgi:hypothetical protein
MTDIQPKEQIVNLKEEIKQDIKEDIRIDDIEEHLKCDVCKEYETNKVKKMSPSERSVLEKNFFLW